MSRPVLTSFVALLILLGGVGTGRAQEHPIAAQVKAKLKDPSKPFTMVVLVKLKDGSTEKFEAAFAKATKETRKEKGSLAYDLNRDADDATRYMVYERWKSLAALEAHLKTPHITALLGEIGELMANPPEVRVLTPVGE